MGLESELKEDLRMTNVRRAILKTIQVAGFITLAAVAPKALAVLGKEQSRWTKKNMSSTLSKLKEKGLVKIEGGKISLTEKGEKFLRPETISVPRPKRWDRKWRVVIFDIPERKRLSRDKLRNLLQLLGFLKIQDSVWVFPFDCEELVLLIKADYRLGKEVLYLIVDKMESDSRIRKHFELGS